MFLTLRMAVLLNIHMPKEPRVPVIPKITMTILGFLTRAVNMSQVSNPHQHGTGRLQRGSPRCRQRCMVVGIANRIVWAMTPERLRGNMALLEHINNNTNVTRYIEEFNNYHAQHQSTTDDDQQMEG